MNSSEQVQTKIGFATRVRSLFRRMGAMAGTWMLLGAVLGLNCEQLFGGSRIELVANIVAWMIVMGMAGAMVSVFGGRPVDSWIGAGLGAAIMLAMGVRMPMAETTPHLQANFGALLGALVAVTCWPWVRMIIALTLRVRRMFASAS